MEITVKKLSIHEKYACSIRAVKALFRNTDAHVHFGSRSCFRSFDFDRYDKSKKKPTISGTVVVSLSISKREGLPYARGKFVSGLKYYHILSFYVIRDSAYTKEHEALFTETYLPQLHQ